MRRLLDAHGHMTSFQAKLRACGFDDAAMKLEMKVRLTQRITELNCQLFDSLKQIFVAALSERLVRRTRTDATSPVF
jgi:hypothetical protein